MRPRENDHSDPSPVLVLTLCWFAFAYFYSGLPVTLTLGFCIATVAILVMDKEESCSQVGVLKRIKENELTTPEEFLASRPPLDVPDDLVLVDDEEEGVANYSGGDKETPSELTPLIAKGSTDV